MTGDFVECSLFLPIVLPRMHVSANSPNIFGNTQNTLPITSLNAHAFITSITKPSHGDWLHDRGLDNGEPNQLPAILIYGQPWIPPLHGAHSPTTAFDQRFVEKRPTIADRGQVVMSAPRPQKRDIQWADVLRLCESRD